MAIRFISKLRGGILGGLGIIPLFAPATLAAAEAEIRIDPHHSQGIWEGWGTSLAWMGNVFGEREDLADFLFSTKVTHFKNQTVPGLGMNIVRYNAGACSPDKVDERRMVASKIILKYRQMEGFWLDGKNVDPQSASWNWKRDAAQRAMLQKAKERGADHFELFSNAPMWWMCANRNPSGAADAMDDNLPVKNHQAFATYLATIAKVAREQWGIRFTSVSPFNEPMSDWWSENCKQEGCHFSHAAQAAFLPVLRAELDRQKLEDLPIAASDETHYDHAVETWKSFTDPVKSLIGRVNVHGYQYGKGDREGLHRSVVEQDGKPLWNSEYGDGDASGLDMARNFHRDMQQLKPTAWCYWQPTDGGGWGMLNCDMVNARVRVVNPKAYVFAQYSRHIRPGMSILPAPTENVVAAYSAKDGRLVLVAFNDGPARTVTFDLSAFAIPDGMVRPILTQPMGTARYENGPEVQIKGRKLHLELPGHSVQTIELNHAVVRQCVIGGI